MSSDGEPSATGWTSTDAATLYAEAALGQNTNSLGATGAVLAQGIVASKPSMFTT
jgi:hypothetical protein